MPHGFETGAPLSLDIIAHLFIPLDKFGKVQIDGVDLPGFQMLPHIQGYGYTLFY